MQKTFISLQTLSNGWANIKFSGDTTEKVFILSYVGGDCLSALIDSAISVLAVCEYKSKFLLEPEEIWFCVKPLADNKLEINVGSELFHSTKEAYVRQILKIFDTYLFLYNIEEYFKEWHYAFPQQKLLQLRTMFRARKIINRLSTV